MPPVVSTGRQPCHWHTEQCPQSLGWRNCYLGGQGTLLEATSQPTSLQPSLQPAGLQPALPSISLGFVSLPLAGHEPVSPPSACFDLPVPYPLEFYEGKLRSRPDVQQPSFDWTCLAIFRGYRRVPKRRHVPHGSHSG